MTELEPIEIHWPEYHSSAMGCGLEDRGIHNRYDAMLHGWECAIERCMEAVPDEPIVLASEVDKALAAKDAETARLREAATDVIASASDTYRKRNGHLGSFQDDSGEKCWIVPFDAFEGLRTALSAQPHVRAEPQDISTAPAMTDVLVWWPLVKLDEYGDPTEEVVGGRWLISEDQGGHWIEPDCMNAIGDHMGDDHTYADKPSHWMPLPAALFVDDAEASNG